jgi:hypothetical protein
MPPDGAFHEFAKPSTGDDEHPSVGEVASQVSEQLPRRRIRQVQVIDQNDHRPFSGDVAKQDCEGLPDTPWQHVGAP